VALDSSSTMQATMSAESPQTQEQIIAACSQQESASLAYWNGFDTETFFRRIDSSWSPAETVRHLSKSIRPVVKALAMPRILLRLSFGKPRRISRSYDDLRTRYLELLAEGGQAGRFAPSPRSETDLEAWRLAIMGEFARANSELRRNIARWRDGKLDYFQLPHPLLGKLTVREMLFFTLYHQRHHIAVVQRRY
jgi:hypothetical protein